MWKEINRHRTGRQNEGEIIDAYGEMKAERLRGVGGYLETKRRSIRKKRRLKTLPVKTAAECLWLSNLSYYT